MRWENKEVGGGTVAPVSRRISPPPEEYCRVMWGSYEVRFYCIMPKSVSITPLSPQTTFSILSIRNAQDSMIRGLCTDWSRGSGI